MGNLTQIPFISNYYQDYFNLINLHKDKTRHSIFCLYLNINKDGSIFNNNTFSTATRFNSGITYNSYELTPIYLIDSFTDMTQSDSQSIGFKFSADTKITTYTIKEPLIGDLIIFAYPPNNSSEIFRVKDISTSLSARNNKKSYFFQLGLEYAPIKNINNIKLINNFIYLNVNNGFHLLKTDFNDFIKYLNSFETVLKNSYFNDNYELYCFEYNDIYYINLYENFIIYNFLNTYRNFFSINIKMPFGVKNYENNDMRILNSDLSECVNEVEKDETKINLINKILYYEERRS